MGNNTVTINMEEYRRLTAIEARVQALVSYAGSYEYNIDRKTIGKILGFKIGDPNGEN